MLNESSPRSRHAARLVAARLQELGRPTDLLTEDAMAILCREAQGSRERLHALLTSALFLASTEDAGAIEADHVCRAALSLGSGAPARALPRRRWGLAVAVSAGICVLASAAWELAGPRHGLQHVPAPASPPAPTMGPPHAPTPAPPAAPTMVPSAPMRPAHGPAAGPPLPAQASPPAAAVQPVPPPLALPGGPPAFVIIRYKTGDKAAEVRARAIASRLRSAQMTVEMRAQPRLKHASVGFFYQEDQGLAARVAAVAGLPGPARENPFDAATLPHPGTIGVTLP